MKSGFTEITAGVASAPLQVDTDLYSGETLVEAIMANHAGLDEGYHSAARVYSRGG